MCEKNLWVKVLYESKHDGRPVPLYIGQIIQCDMYRTWCHIFNCNTDSVQGERLK